MEKLREISFDAFKDKEKNDSYIVIKQAYHHNLKNVSLKIPKNKMIVFTGVSGSGKSTLVFDIIHSESQRRFISGLSAFMRRGMEKIEKPKVKYISGLTPSLAIEQKSVSNNPRSTVGTLTEISDYLRLLYSRIGVRTCPVCGKEIKNFLYKNSTYLCPQCGEPIKFLMSNSFSSNTPQGMCPKCKGLGKTQKIDLGILIENENVSILDGAIKWFGNLREGNRTMWPCGPLDIIYNHYNTDIETPWKDIPEKLKNVILYGSGDEKIEFPAIMGGKTVFKPVKGVASEIERLYFDTKSEFTRKKYASYMSFCTCNECHGKKLNKDALNVKIYGKTIYDVNNMSIADALNFIKKVYECSDQTAFNIGKDVIIEIFKRLRFLNDVGLHYLTLDRIAPTLSGGEGQRVRLATALSTEITGITYVLDEPSAGLHMRDTENLIRTLYKLRNNGNTVIVVEHNADIIKSADYIVDIGPYAGVLGGNVLYSGKASEITGCKDSLTGMYLSGSLNICDDFIKNKINTDFSSCDFITIKGACHNNLKNITAHFPLNKMTCVTGVSGSGKSSLISETLKPLLENKINNCDNLVGQYSDISGYESIDKVIDVSQDPIGRTPRSNPATYVGLFDKIRRVFAKTDYAVSHNMDADFFSFNSTKGRCPYCEGQGQIKVEMHFMPDVWIKCDECHGRRFRNEVLENKINGKNISDILEMDVNEAADFLKDYKDIYAVLQIMQEVGLGYIKLGQNATTLSGGEAQRVKIAKELCRKTKGRALYILDEPTTGLHFNDVKLLLKLFKRLIKDGHTIIVIEHNKNIIRCADWIVDIGPEGGNDGGRLLVEGPISAVKKCKESITAEYI